MRGQRVWTTRKFSRHWALDHQEPRSAAPGMFVRGQMEGRRERRKQRGREGVDRSLRAGRRTCHAALRSNYIPLEIGDSSVKRRRQPRLPRLSFASSRRPSSFLLTPPLLLRLLPLAKSGRQARRLSRPAVRTRQPRGITALRSPLVSMPASLARLAWQAFASSVRLCLCAKSPVISGITNALGHQILPSPDVNATYKYRLDLILLAATTGLGGVAPLSV